MCKLKCGCTPDASGYGYCGECTRALRKKIWSEMSEEKKDYDRQMAPSESKYLDELSRSCECHICPPCSYCISQSENDHISEFTKITTSGDGGSE